MILLCEGPDAVGKSTQVQKLLPLLHNLTTHQWHYSAIKGFSSPEETKEYSSQTYNNMFNILQNNYEENNFILDRSHIGEMVYSPLYRDYSGDYVLDLEWKWSKDATFWNQLYLITFIDDPEHLIARDDGLSFSIELNKKQDEVNRFIEATKKSYIMHKHILNISGRTIDQVHEEVRRFLNV